MLPEASDGVVHHINQSEAYFFDAPLDGVMTLSITTAGTTLLSITTLYKGTQHKQH
jgi:hypothetical protein